MTVHIHVIIMIGGERCGFTEIRSNSLFINSNTTIRENTEHIMQEKWRGSVEILSVRSIRRSASGAAASQKTSEERI